MKTLLTIILTSMFTITSGLLSAQESPKQNQKGVQELQQNNPNTRNARPQKPNRYVTQDSIKANGPQRRGQQQNAADRNRRNKDSRPFNGRRPEQPAQAKKGISDIQMEIKRSEEALAKREESLARARLEFEQQKKNGILMEEERAEKEQAIFNAEKRNYILKQRIAAKKEMLAKMEAEQEIMSDSTAIE